MKCKSIIRFNGVYYRDNLPDEIKNSLYVINLDEHTDIGTHWIALYALNNNVTYLTVFKLNVFQKELKLLSINPLLQQIFIEYK